MKLLSQIEDKIGRKKKRFWIKKLYAERLQKAEFHLLVRDLRLHDPEYFFKYFQMSRTKFDELLSFVSPVIGKQSTVMGNTISPSERLAVTLQYLVTGHAQCKVAAGYRKRPSAVTRIITETCGAIWTSLKRMLYLDCLSNVSKWKVLLKNLKVNGIFHTQLVPLVVNMWSCRLCIMVDLHTLITRKRTVLSFWLFVTLSMSLQW